MFRLFERACRRLVWEFVASGDTPLQRLHEMPLLLEREDVEDPPGHVAFDRVVSFENGFCSTVVHLPLTSTAKFPISAAVDSPAIDWRGTFLEFLLHS
ncbi:MAG: hypothetical protein ACRYGK_07750 [Janthinobacterium lividum]